MTRGAEGERPALSIIIPALNEAHSIRVTIDALKKLSGSVEVIVVDGGSQDGTVEILRTSGVCVIHSQRGRGIQMHAGANIARGEVLWFLHADTIPPTDAADLIGEAIKDAGVLGGNFCLRFDSELMAARFLTWLYPQLGKVGLCYGDSGIFVRRDAYHRLGGFRPLPIFEDLELVRQLRRLGRMAHIQATLITSSRRFKGRSFALTFARWSVLQVLYWIGIHPRRLGRMYAPVRVKRGDE